MILLKDESGRRDVSDEQLLETGNVHLAAGRTTLREEEYDDVKM